MRSLAGGTSNFWSPTAVFDAFLVVFFFPLEIGGFELIIEFLVDPVFAVEASFLDGFDAELFLVVVFYIAV